MLVLLQGVKIKFMGNSYDVAIRTEKQQEYSKYMKPKIPLDTSKFCLSPMPGTLISVAVQPGDVVESGQEIAVVEVCVPLLWSVLWPCCCCCLHMLRVDGECVFCVVLTSDG